MCAWPTSICSLVWHKIEQLLMTSGRILTFFPIFDSHSLILKVLLKRSYMLSYTLSCSQ